MGHILRGLEYRFALIYIDDIIIFSKSVDEHLVHLEEVFRGLCDANVELNPKKCSFVKQRLEYLGHVVTPEGISPNPDKVRVIQETKTKKPKLVETFTFRRQSSCKILLQQYDLNIVHRPGRIHGNADCLSRRPYDSCEISSPKKEEPQNPTLKKCKEEILNKLQ